MPVRITSLLIAVAIVLFVALPVAPAQSPADLQAAIEHLEKAKEALTRAQSADPPEVVAASTAGPVEASRSSLDRDTIADEIITAARDSDLSEREKSRIVGTMEKPRWWQFRKRRVRDRVIDQAIDGMFTEELVVATPDGVEPAVDWDAIASFFERMLPLILQIVSLF